MIFSKKHKLADIILHDYSLIPVLSRFGIELGFGEKTAGEICKTKKIDINFFLLIVNSSHDSLSLPREGFSGISLELIIDYLQKSHIYFNEIKIPKIEKLIKGLEWETGDLSFGKIISEFFDKYKQEVFKHTAHEESSIYPYLAKHSTPTNQKNIEQFDDKPDIETISDYVKNHDDLDEKLYDLKNIIIKYLPPVKNPETVYELINELFILEKELLDHARIENKVLIPGLKNLEKTLKIDSKKGKSGKS